MRGGIPPDSWSYQPPNRTPPRESPERRRQARGRIGVGRPTSVGSARFISPSSAHQNAQRALFQGIPLSSYTAGVTPRTSITPGLPRQTPTGSTGTNNRTLGNPSSVEEASPPVAVGSGITAGDRQMPTSTPPQRRSPASATSFADYFNNPAAAELGQSLNQQDANHFNPGRTPSYRPGMGSRGLSAFETRYRNLALSPSPIGDINPSTRDSNFQDTASGYPQPRWSR